MCKPLNLLKSRRGSTHSESYMNCALANLQAADRSLDRLGERISALRAGFQMYLYFRRTGWFD